MDLAFSLPDKAGSYLESLLFSSYKHTIGFKQELERHYESIVIEEVEIKLKYAYIDGDIIKYKAEYEDCAEWPNF